jgi:hypothetical protein
VTGANTGFNGTAVRDSWRVDRDDLLPHGKDRVWEYSNSLIEYAAEELGGIYSCEGVAKRLVKEHSRDPYTVSLPQAAAEPSKVRIGTTVGLQDPRIDLATKRSFFVMSFTRTFGNGKFRDTNIILDGGVGPDGYTEQPDPTPVIAYRLAQETLNGVTYVEVFLDGTGSFAFGASEVVDWDWSDDQVPQQTHSGKFAMFRYLFTPALLVVNVTLMVTDVLGKVAETTIAVNLRQSPTGPVIVRVLNFAAGSGWYVTPDGGKNWFHESGQPATAVPPIDAGGNEGATEGASSTYGLITTGGNL